MSVKHKDHGVDLNTIPMLLDRILYWQQNNESNPSHLEVYVYRITIFVLKTISIFIGVYAALPSDVDVWQPSRFLEGEAAVPGVRPDDGSPLVCSSANDFSVKKKYQNKIMSNLDTNEFGK